MTFRRWSVAIYATETGDELDCPWVRFWTRRGAEDWAYEGNTVAPSPLTVFVVRRL